MRALRANPPGRAAAYGSRRDVFTAALEQAEQFLTAAESVGYATKPVQLFYALSQAGRAIAAVRVDEQWDIQGHGARVNTSQGVAATTVKPDASAGGAIRVVARATDSDLWEGPVALGALWASLPELPPDPDLVGPAAGALEVERDYSPAMSGFASIQIDPGTGFVTTTGLTWRVGLRVEDKPPDPETQKALIETLLAPYPKAKGWSLASGLFPSNIDQTNRTIVIEWIREDGGGQRVVTSPELLTDEYAGKTYFRPGLGPTEAVPSPLITWWGVLLALSSLARYEPVAWRRALDIDDSPIAWALERGLTIAEQRIPELVLSAISSA